MPPRTGGADPSHTGGADDATFPRPPGRPDRAAPRGRALQGGADDLQPPGRRDHPGRRLRGGQPVRQQLPGAGRPSCADRGGRGGGCRLRLRHGVGAVHLRHPRRPPPAGSGVERLPRHRGHHPLRVVLRRQRRALRDPARRGGRRHLGRPQPRLDHRRGAAVQGSAVPVRQQRHGRPGAAARGGGRRPVPADRHRRGLLHGRDRRRPAGDLRAGRPARRHGHGGRLPRRRVHGPARRRHP